MVPSQRARRSKKQELVKYLDEPAVDRSPRNPDVARVLKLRPGIRMLIEVEALAVPDRSCVAGNLCIIDGPNHQSFPEVLLQIHEVRFKT